MRVAIAGAHGKIALRVSAVGADDPPAGDDVFSVYLRAKAEADEAVRASGEGPIAQALERILGAEQ